MPPTRSTSKSVSNSTEKPQDSRKKNSNMLVLSPADEPRLGKIVLRPESYTEAVMLVKKHFEICRGYDVVLRTNELELCDKEMLEITEMFGR
ncbi:hypothetical protein E1B28_013582 [Marasmius oreades]|uniref:Uncharacterized protein n=1 Tax=Marasmius oreades TaxID=181124 RepID=A0A9P7UQ19_9AGAR|nr:uncharacterized protein E1B28_013582 [Marasmius oreades]KAG7087634.1 hypothetical protein E1B28_013582 [Marasmius oreades]